LTSSASALYRLLSGAMKKRRQDRIQLDVLRQQVEAMIGQHQELRTDAIMAQKQVEFFQMCLAALHAQGVVRPADDTGLAIEIVNRDVRLLEKVLQEVTPRITRSGTPPDVADETPQTPIAPIDGELTIRETYLGGLHDEIDLRRSRSTQRGGE
jgi:hypothetical protein